jgi:hypothetical protein
MLLELKVMDSETKKKFYTYEFFLHLLIIFFLYFISFLFIIHRKTTLRDIILCGILWGAGLLLWVEAISRTTIARAAM